MAYTDSNRNTQMMTEAAGLEANEPIPSNRLIPVAQSQSINKPSALKPDPLIDVAASVSQPDEIYQIYRGKFYCSMCLVTLLSLPASAFEVMLPLLIGYMVSDDHEEWLLYLIVTLGVMMISGICMQV